jgi:hypothetical protein
MADDKKNQDKLNDDDMGQMGGQASYSGQKGGQSQAGHDDTNTGMANDPASKTDSSLNDEDL